MRFREISRKLRMLRMQSVACVESAQGVPWDIRSILLTIYVLSFPGINKNVSTLYIFPPHWHDTNSWNPSLCKTRTQIQKVYWRLWYTLAGNTVLTTVCSTCLLKQSDRIHSTQSGVKLDQITNFDSFDTRCIRLFDFDIGRQFVFLEDVI